MKRFVLVLLPVLLASLDVAAQGPSERRIVCVCDAFNAMITDRPYRARRSVAEALAELQRCAGTQFDPRVVAATIEAVTEIESSEGADALRSGLPLAA